MQGSPFRANFQLNGHQAAERTCLLLNNRKGVRKEFSNVRKSEKGAKKLAKRQSFIHSRLCYESLSCRDFELLHLAVE